MSGCLILPSGIAETDDQFHRSKNDSDGTVADIVTDSGHAPSPSFFGSATGAATGAPSVGTAAGVGASSTVGVTTLTNARSASETAVTPSGITKSRTCTESPISSALTSTSKNCG